MNQRQPKPQDGGDTGGEAFPHCGIIMPIATMTPEYDAAHWERVKDVLGAAIRLAGYTPRLVSDSNEIGVIHARIVQNLYDDEIVVCDVSNKNPNVMFELGLRLAFDKPTIVVKDEVTTYSFDTGPIEHIGYRRDQRFDDVEIFKEKVAHAILATVQRKRQDPKFSPFLKHFGSFTPKQVEHHELPQAEYLLKKLDEIESTLYSFILPLNDFMRHIAVGERVGKPDYVGLVQQSIRNWMEVRKIREADASMVQDDARKYAREKLSGVIPFMAFDSVFDSAWTKELGLFS